jgi:hypothetical protein
VIYGIGTIPDIIVVIEIIGIMNDGCISVISVATMVIIVIMPVNTNSHYRKCSKIGWVVTVIIGGIIGYICR